MSDEKSMYVVIIHSGCNKDIPFVYDVIMDTEESLDNLRKKLEVTSEKVFDYHHEDEDNEDNMLTSDIEMKIPLNKLKDIVASNRNFPVVIGHRNADATVYLFLKDDDKSAFDYIDELIIV